MSIIAIFRESGLVKELIEKYGLYTESIYKAVKKFV